MKVDMNDFTPEMPILPPFEDCGSPPKLNAADFAVETKYISERDKQNAVFTEIVQAFKTYYQKKSRDNHFYKRIFFWVVMALLLLIAGGFVFGSVALVRHTEKWEIIIPIAGGGAAALITALLKLPEIIATHLFPKSHIEEDQVIIELIKVLKDEALSSSASPR